MSDQQHIYIEEGDKVEKRKLYVTVSAEHRPDGTCLPKSIKLANNSEYFIDRIVQVKRSASDVGGRGVRYSIIIGRQQTYLYDEQNGKWFVEAKFG